MRDYAELVKALRTCKLSNPCSECPYYSYGETQTKECGTMNDAAADAIEELLAVCRDVSAFVICYADDDEVIAEVLCRKLYKIGVVEKDGAWWTLPELPKEEHTDETN